MKRLILALLVLVVIAAGVLIFLNDSSEKTKPEVKTAVVPEANPYADPSYSPKALFALPSYNMVDGNGEVFGSEDLAGQVYFIFTFSGNCDEPCSSSLAVLKSAKNTMEQSFRTWNELAYVAINSDESITQEGLAEFAEKNDLKDSWYMLRTWIDFPQNVLPADYNPEQEVMLVDREGLVRARFNLSDEGVEEKIIQLTRRVLRDPHKRIADPLEIINPEWLDKRMVAQLKKRDRIQSFVDFSFEDKVQESQIAWRHQVADDAGKT
jgi:cytochrome oxidase Cu insertion factor (SCO1/SenC/PrrC family)